MNICMVGYGMMGVWHGDALAGTDCRLHTLVGRRAEVARLTTERDEARALLERKWDKEDPPLVRMMRERDEAREESLEQARLLGKGGSREARLITERDHYKEAVEEISVTIQDWLDSIVQ